MKPRRWVIYGANGYTGRLIAEEALRRGERPVLAGRRREEIEALGKQLGLEAVAFPLADAATTPALTGAALVVNAAGPFSQTSAALVGAALARRFHYLDITGEISIFEAIFKRDAEAKKSGVVLLPGVGFDVVPSDCLAAQLKKWLPDAVRLELAIAAGNGVSAGTMKTMLESLPDGGQVRRGGKLVRAPFGRPRKRVRFSHRELDVAAIPWGDVATAYRSTAIPDITVYAALPPKLMTLFPVLEKAASFLTWGPVFRRLNRLIERKIVGPDEAARKAGRGHLWGRVEAASGKSVEAHLDTPEGYRLTALATVDSVLQVLDGKVAPGAWTPSGAFGADFITRLPEVTLRQI